MRKISKLVGLAAVVLSSTMVSCSSSNEEESVDLGETKTVVNMLSDTEPIVLTAAQRQFANDNNAFTLDFLKTVNEADHSGKSFIYSPLSITYVLGMVNDAATGTTERELEETLGFHEGGILAVNEYCRKLIEGLPRVDKKVTLNLANAIFVNKDKATLKAQYEQDMQTYYDAKAEALSFKDSKTLGHINGWCNDKTKGMIPTILDEINPYAVAYLLNAIYFKADWASKFDEKNTRKETFTTEGGTTQVPLMHQNVLINYTKNNTYAAVQMPYGNGSWMMTVLLPNEGKTAADVIAAMRTDDEWRVGFYTSQMSPYEVDLKLPRFETNSDTDDIDDGLKGLMQKMGIHMAFDSELAEIPNMCEERGVYISKMRQKAAIKVNEEGSEAAAVTIAEMEFTTAVGPTEYPKATFHANRPFVYFISERSSGVILFVGKYTGA